MSTGRAVATPDGTTADRVRVSGATAVAAGLSVFGLSAYGFLTVAAHSVSPAEFSVVATLWSALYALANGLFIPLEQEATRAVAERTARGEVVGPVVVRVAALGAAMVSVLTAGLLLGRRPLADRLFAGQVGIVVVLAVALAAAAAIFVTRGLLAGTQHYWTYAGQLAGEGTIRFAAAAALGLAGAGSALRMGALVAAAPIVVLVVTVVVLPRPGGSPRPGKWGEVGANLGWLVLAALCSYGVSNAGPVVLQLMGNHDAGLAGRFLAAFVLVRVPLFFTAALQAGLLPRLVTAVERGDPAGFVAALRSMLTVVGALGVVALAGFATVGPLVVRVFFGAHYTAARVDLVALGLSSVVFVLATMLQSAALALGGHRWVAAFWAGGAVVFAGCCLLPLAPVSRLDLGYCASAGVVLAAMVVWLSRRLDQPGRPVPGQPI